MPSARKPIVDRFWPKVEKTATCWLWTGAKNGFGYGQIGSGGKYGRPLIASRVSWEIENGPIPDGLFVCHRCDNPPCVRPDHLFLGTCQDNLTDMKAKGRSHHQDRRGSKNNRYGAVMSESQRVQIAASLAKRTYRLLAPSGEVIEITNMKKWCRENDMNEFIYQIANGKHSGSYKGYRTAPPIEPA